MWNSNIIVSNITRLVQMIFSTWFGYFECVSYLPSGVTLTVLNLYLDSFVVKLLMPIWREISQHKTSPTTFDIFGQSRHLLHILHKSFFAFQFCFYLSCNSKAWYAEKAAFFLPSSALKWIHKNSSILIFLSAHWYDYYHNTV